ncbi:ATP synthase, F0 subunit b [Longilinea arvoryzae]|uniref:ATP synthase subunit b n=1 Tax=Longilinea arvoryzae TaxID=360412 RepID=A0A0S7BC00_9CHLR|nr:F0F1 ATP synthase subunit B [Longilinea arvoryzae]GAP15271.1 ATP synthase, F0 subunit b [Longilinea arvoryzae]
MDKLGLNLGYLLVQILHFGMIFVVVLAWVVKPVMGLLEKRRKTLAQGLEDARIAADARANAEREATQILSDAQVKSAEIVREATNRAETAAREVHAAAEADAAKTRAGALADFEQERTRILGELRGQVAALSIAAAQKLIGESLDENRQRSLLDEFFSGVKSGKLVLLKDGEVSGAAAEVTSALPLTESEQETVKRDVLARMGGSATVSFRVDPSILGGLVLRVGDRVIDSSVAGQLQDLRQNLQ